MKQLEDSMFEQSPAQRLFGQVLNHSVDLEAEWIQEQRKSRAETSHKTIWLGHVGESFTFYFNNKMYMFDCSPASSLYEIRRIFNGNFSVSMSIGTDISAKLIKG